MYQVIVRMSVKKFIYVRLREEDRSLLREIAQTLDISEAAVIKIALKEFAENHKVKVISK